tara:strand:- start:423 stop:584 length:162 start_codon:yes stop_codon:yes gene_type:complete
MGKTQGEMKDKTPAENARNGPVKLLRSFEELLISMRAIAKIATGTIMAAPNSR